MWLQTILVTLVALFSTCFASEYNNELINEIIAIDSSCIRKQFAEKVYLDSERIYPTDQGYFIRLKNEQYLVTPFLYVDSEGFYLLTSSELARLNTEVKKSVLIVAG